VAAGVLTIGTYAAAMLKRPPRDPVLATAMLLFAVGLVSVAATFTLFATGHRDLPAWLSASSVLLPIGFAIGAVHTVRQWRRSQTAKNASTESTEDNNDTDDAEDARKTEDAP
jgi:uncharacterized membrane protein YhdT